MKDLKGIITYYFPNNNFDRSITEEELEEVVGCVQRSILYESVPLTCLDKKDALLINLAAQMLSKSKRNEHYMPEIRKEVMEKIKQAVKEVLYENDN